MSRPLTHRPFEALEPAKPEVTIVRRRTTDPESGLKLVRQVRPTPLPTDPPPNARLTPDPSEAEEVAGKKKKRRWTEEQRAKMRATWAAKKKRGEPVGAQAWRGKKKARRKKKATVDVPRVFRLQRTTATSELASPGSSLTILLDRLIAAAEEIKRRLG